MEISLCMIVKNEEDKLGACLDSVCGLVDEINIVDTGSTDNTVEIAKKYTERVFHFDWINDFSAARNFSFSKATKDYIMWLDADDIIESSEKEKLKNLKMSSDKSADCIYMYYAIKDADGLSASTLKRERIVKRDKCFKWTRPIHEYIEVSGKKTFEDIYITQVGKSQETSIKRNIEILESITNNENCQAIDHYYYGIALYQNGDIELALKHLLIFIKNNDNLSFTGCDAYTCIYNIYMLKGDYENAYIVLAQNENKNRDKSEFYCCLGNFMSDVLKDYNAAIKHYEKALSCSGKEADGETFTHRIEDYYHFEPYYLMGMTYVKLNLFEKAIHCLAKAHEYQPEKKDIQLILDKLNQIVKISRNESNNDS